MDVHAFSLGHINRRQNDHPNRTSDHLNKAERLRNQRSYREEVEEIHVLDTNVNKEALRINIVVYCSHFVCWMSKKQKGPIISTKPAM